MMIVLATADIEYALLETALDKYGLMGVFILGTIIFAIMYQKNESKKIDLEIIKNTETAVIKEETQKVSGLVEQMQRESESSMSEVKEILTTLEMEALKRGHSEQDMKSTLIEVKTQLREVSRDVNRSN